MKFLIILMILTSCSFKHPDQSNKSSDQLRIDPTRTDSDGDGLMDANDEDPMIADVPSFEGEMLEEVKIKTTFYNRSLDKFKETEMLVKSEDENIVVKKGMSFVKSLAENEAALSSDGQDFLSLSISNKQIDLYTAPVITDGVAHNFMAQSSDLENQGYFLDSVDFEIRNRINIKSSRFTNFRDIIFDVYFYDYQTKKIEFLDSFKNLGSFEFNKDHLLDIVNIQTRNTRIMDNSVLKTGKFLYVKIKDFFIPDLKLNYSDLMLEVQKKTIPVIVNEPKDYHVYYVGTNSNPSSFVNLIQSALKKDYEIDNNKFIKYKDFPVGEYREETGSGQRENITSKWSIITNEINNNPFSYTFLPKDMIFLNYSKSSDKIFLPTNVANTFSETKKELILKGEGFYPARARKIKIILSNIVYIDPAHTTTTVNKPTCSQGARCVYGQVQYMRSTVDIVPTAITSNDESFQILLDNTFLIVDGFEYSLNKFLSEKKFTLSIDKENKVSIESTDIFMKNLKSFGSEMAHLSLKHKPTSLYVEVGDKLTDCGCASACGGPPVRIGCSQVQDRGATEMQRFQRDFSFYTSLFIF